MLTRDDDAFAVMRLEVFGRDLGEFRGVPAQMSRRQPLDSDRRRDGERESLDLARPDRQSVVGLGARRRQCAFGDVEAVHLLRAAGQSATTYKIARVADAARPAGQEVGVEREHAVGLVELIDSVDRLAEGNLRAQPRPVPRGRLIGVPFRLRESGLRLFNLIGECGRSGGLGQYSQPRALLLALTYNPLF